MDDKSTAFSAAEPARRPPIGIAKDEAIGFLQVGHRSCDLAHSDRSVPNYEEVLPRGEQQTVVLERSEAQRRCRRVSQLADQRSHAVKACRRHRGRGNFRLKPDTVKPKRPSTRLQRATNRPSVFTSRLHARFLAALPTGTIRIELK